jgi:hypothetical protein
MRERLCLTYGNAERAWQAELPKCFAILRREIFCRHLEHTETCAMAELFLS